VLSAIEMRGNGACSYQPIDLGPGGVWYALFVHMIRWVSCVRVGCTKFSFAGKILFAYV